jgi:hypothetical protein
MVADRWKIDCWESYEPLNFPIEFYTFIAESVLKFGGFICYATELFSLASIF